MSDLPYPEAGQVYRNHVGAVMTVVGHVDKVFGIRALGSIFYGTTANPDGPPHEWLFTARHLADCGYALQEIGEPS